MASPTVTTRVLDGFDDPTFGPDQWEELLRDTDSDVVYLTWHYQRSWWETFARGELLLVAAEREGRVFALAPLYSRSGMIYFIGAAYWLADRFDFLGDLSGPDVVGALLETARARVPDFKGFRFEFVPADSRTGKLLQGAADRLGLSCYEEWDYCASALHFRGGPEIARADVNRKSLRKLERFFRRSGSLQVHHLRDGEAIRPHLEEFFAQHIARWVARRGQSIFADQAYRAFYERLTRIAARTGWLRFTRLDWNGQPIAFHYGYCYRGRYYWDASSFAVELAEHSPGQFLMKQLLLAAIDEGARTFDFGTGDQPFKLRFASQTTCVKGWGLYCRSDSRHGAHAAHQKPHFEDRACAADAEGAEGAAGPRLGPVADRPGSAILDLGGAPWR